MKIFLFILFLIVAIVIWSIWYDSFDCLVGHNTVPNYHAPSYVMVGKGIMMPVGGGTYTDWVCDKHK